MKLGRQTLKTKEGLKIACIPIDNNLNFSSHIETIPKNLNQTCFSNGVHNKILKKLYVLFV